MMLAALIGVLVVTTTPPVAVAPVKVPRALGNAPALTRALEADLVETGRFAVLAPPATRSVLADRRVSDYAPRVDPTTRVALGRESAATGVAVAHVARHGRQCEVSIKLFDLERTTASRAASAVAGCRRSEIRGVLRRAAFQLAGVDLPARTDFVANATANRTIPEPVRRPAKKKRRRRARVNSPDTTAVGIRLDGCHVRIHERGCTGSASLVDPFFEARVERTGHRWRLTITPAIVRCAGAVENAYVWHANEDQRRSLMRVARSLAEKARRCRP